MRLFLVTRVLGISQTVAHYSGENMVIPHERLAATVTMCTQSAESTSDLMHAIRFRVLKNDQPNLTLSSFDIYNRACSFLECSIYVLLYVKTVPHTRATDILLRCKPLLLQSSKINRHSYEVANHGEKTCFHFLRHFQPASSLALRCNFMSTKCFRKNIQKRFLIKSRQRADCLTSNGNPL